MNEYELNQFGQFLFERYFEKELAIPIKINNRLRRVHAWFVHGEDLYIEVSKHLAQQSIYIIADILMHEFTHYYLFMNNKPYKDEDFEFRALLYKNGINETETAKVCADGIMRYEYWKYESKCACDFQITSFHPANNMGMNPILICPNCNKKLPQSAVGIVYEDFMAPFRLKMACDTYLDRQNTTLNSLEEK